MMIKFVYRINLKGCMRYTECLSTKRDNKLIMPDNQVPLPYYYSSIFIIVCKQAFSDASMKIISRDGIVTVMIKNKQADIPEYEECFKV